MISSVAAELIDIWTLDDLMMPRRTARRKAFGGVPPDAPDRKKSRDNNGVSIVIKSDDVVITTPRIFSLGKSYA
jgi:hypothetical protein